MSFHTPAHKSVSKTENEWVSVNERLPKDGEKIEGRNEKGETWTEFFNKEEPLGRMLYWRKFES